MVHKEEMIKSGNRLKISVLTSLLLSKPTPETSFHLPRLVHPPVREPQVSLNFLCDTNSERIS